MRTSCNGCRVLRKGCSDDCAIRPCLHWIKSPEAQGNATVFLAKFYGRAGLLNLLNAGPEHLRPAVFQSLLYEASGRVVDPVNGSVGLLYTGQWHHCQAAVDAVLKGLPIMQLPPLSPEGLSSNGVQQMTLPPLKLYDIRHMSLSKDLAGTVSLAAPEFSQKVRTRPRLRRRRPRMPVLDSDQHSFNGGGDEINEENGYDHSPENLSMFSAETTTEGSVAGQIGQSEVGLELTLGFNKYGEML